MLPRHPARLFRFLVPLLLNPQLRACAAGLRADEAAVRAGLTAPWRTGPVAGQITRLKRIKRQGYGRAGFTLLRQRVLRTAG